MATYYVSPSGSDSAAGSTGSPWKTLGKALAAASNGDTVRVRTGTYYEQLQMDTPNVTFEADAGHTPTIDGRYHPGLFGAAGFKGKSGGSLSSNELPYVNGSQGTGPSNARLGGWVVSHDDTAIVQLRAAGVKVRGFIIRNVAGRICVFKGPGAILEDCIGDFSYGGSVSFEDEAIGAIMRGCTMTRGSIKFYDPTRERGGGTVSAAVQTSVIIKSQDNIVENCTIAFNYGEGISADKGSKRAIIRYNTIHTNAHWGLGFNHTDGSKFYGNVSYWCENLMSEFDKDTPGDLFVGGTERSSCGPPAKYLGDALMPDVYIYNNLFVGGKRSWLLGGSSRPATMVRSYIGYNTFVGRPNSGHPFFFMWQSMPCQGHIQTVVENNIFWAGAGRSLKIQNNGSVKFRNNLTNFAPPPEFSGNGNLRADSGVMSNPMPASLIGTYNHKSTDLPNVATNFNQAHYDLTGSSAAVGRASDRSNPYGWSLPPVNIDRRKDGRTDYNLGQGRYYDIGQDEFGGTVVPPDPTVTAAFAMNPAATTVTVGASASFTNQSFADNCNITGYIWTVKRGSSVVQTATSTNLNNVAFSDTGTWTVSLAVATDETGVSDTETVTITVNPSGGDPSVTAGFSRSPSATTIDQGTTVQFTNTSTVSNTTKTGQTWEVRTSPGDTLVTSATTNNFTYQFDTDGTFVVKLTVNTAAGVSDTESVTITVNAVSQAFIDASFTSSHGAAFNAGVAVTFTNTSTATDTTITGYSWTIAKMGGSEVTTYITEDIVHTFSAGTWLVVLDIQSAAGTSDDYRLTVVAAPEVVYGADLYRTMIVPYRVALNTTTGEQTITTVALGDIVPTGITIRLTAATADGTPADGALWAEGATDGVSQWSLCRYSQDGISSGASYRRYKSGALLQTLDATGAVTGEATFARFVPGGVVIAISDAFPAAYLAEIDFYAGDDMRVAAGTTLLSTVGADVNVTTGINQDVVYFATTWAPDGASGATEEADMSRGWATADGQQAAVRNQDKHNTNPSALNTRYSTLYCAISGDGTTGVLAFVEARDWSATGFNLRLASNNLDSRPVGWFAVSLGGPQVSLLTTTLTIYEHSLDFEPQTVLGLLTSAAGSTPVFTDANAEGNGAYAMSIYSSAAEYTMWITSADAAATRNTVSLSDDTFRAITPAGTALWAGGGTLAADGLTFTFSTHPTVAYITVLLAVEKGEPLPTTPPPAPSPIADFTADPRQGVTKLGVQFDSSPVRDFGEPIVAYLWDFGDGMTSTAANPFHIYKKEGAFTVTLTITNANGQSTEIKDEYVVTSYPVTRRTLVGPSRPQSIRSDSTNDVLLDHSPDDDTDSELGFHSHAPVSQPVLRIVAMTADEIANLAAESDGEHVTVVWNSDDNQINVIDGEGNIIAV